MYIDQLQDIEENIKEARKIVEFGAALDRLRNNKDFKAIILDGYFKTEAIRLVHLKADPSMDTPERQANIIKGMDAIGALSEYFHVVDHQAQLARKAIDYGEEAISEILDEEA